MGMVILGVRVSPLHNNEWGNIGNTYIWTIIGRTREHRRETELGTGMEHGLEKWGSHRDRSPDVVGSGTKRTMRLDFSFRI